MADPNWKVVTLDAVPPRNKLYVYYRCSKCNHSNVHEHTISGISAKDKLAAKKEEILTKAQERNYAPAVFRCKCEKCGHVENWSKYSPPALEKCANVNFGLALLAAVGTIIGFLPWVLIPTFLGIFLHACIISLIIDGARTKQARAMDAKHLPIIAADMDTLKKQVAIAFPDSNAQPQQPARPQQQNNAYARQAEQAHFTPKQPEVTAQRHAPATPKQPEVTVQRHAPATPKQPGYAHSAGISIADEILKFKGLMDAGIITSEEFEAKKKQLLKM